MSDTSQGEGWWLASDGKWYPPESRPAWPPPQASPWAPPGTSPPTGEAAPSAEPGSGTTNPPGSWQQPAGSQQPWGYQPPQAGPASYPPPGQPYPGAYPPGGGYGYPYGPPGFPPNYSTRPAVVVDQQTGLWLAPWWKRLVAILIDFLVLGAVFLVVGLVADAAQGRTSNRTVDAVSVVLFGVEVLVGLLYYAIMNGSKRGQTVGKMAMSIACRDARSGGPIGFWRGLGRYLIEIVFEIALVVPFLLDCLSPLWDRRRQAWHDHVVKSIVVEVDRQGPQLP